MYARFFHFWAPKALKRQKTGFWRFLAISEGIRLGVFSIFVVFYFFGYSESYMLTE